MSSQIIDLYESGTCIIEQASERKSTAIQDLIFHFDIECLKRVSSELLNTKCIQSHHFSSDVLFLLDGLLLFDEKIHQSAALFWFGLRNVGILQIFYSQAVIQRTIFNSPTFLETGLAEKIAVCAHSNHLPKKQEDQSYFCMKLLRTLNSFQIFKIKIKKYKNL